jgi:hypothetical protein
MYLLRSQRLSVNCQRQLALSMQYCTYTYSIRVHSHSSEWISSNNSCFPLIRISRADCCVIYLYYLFYSFSITPLYASRDSVVSIATSYVLDDQEAGVRVPVGSRIFSSPRRPDRPWGPPKLLSTGYRGGSFPGVKVAGACRWPLLQLVSRSRKCGSIHPIPHTPSWCSS